jgi:O-antigen/teichoic acid export membrane protein
LTSQVYSAHRFRKALWQFVGGRLGQLAARAVLVLALVRILPVADYGAYMLIIGTAELLLQVGSFGILPLAQRYLPQMLTTLPIHKLYRFVSFLVVAQLVVLTVIAALLGHYWHLLGPVFGLSQQQIERTSLAAWLFLVIPAFRFSAELLEAMLAQGQTARAVMVFVRAAAIVVLVLVKPHIGLTDVLVVDLVSTSACVLLSWSSIRQTMASLHSPAATGSLPVKEMFTFAWHMALVGPMSGTASPGAIRLALANGLGVAQSGLFAFLQSLERLVSRYLPATLVRNLIRPILISRAIGQGSTDLLKAGTGLLLKSNMLTVVGGLIVIAVCGDQIVFIMSGHKFRGAGLTLLLLYVNMIATSQRGVQEMVMQITGHTRALWITTVVSPIALFMVWLFSRYGLNVAVLIVTMGSMTANWLASWVLQSRTDWFRVDWRGMAAIFLAGFPAGALGKGLALWIHPLVAGAITPLFFVAFLRFSKPFKQSEIRPLERALGARAAGVLRGFAV